jgi:SAM-dependent methyltransferase
VSASLPPLVDPTTQLPLTLEQDGWRNAAHVLYPIVRGVARFVPSDNYAADFGEQWNRFPKTQLDSHSGTFLSSSRLQRVLGPLWASLADREVLEAGSGAGRFSEVLLAQGARLDSFDYSSAVDANFAAHGGRPGFRLVQADLRQMPYPAAHYDLVLCLGVIQHTPNPEESIRALWSRVKPGGWLAFDHYRRKVRNYLPPPIGVGGMAYRWYFLSLPRERRFAAVKRVVDFWFPLVWRFRASKWIQFVIARFNPVVNYYPQFGLRDRDMYYEWMLLDTHDAMTDVYKHRRSAGEIRRFLASLGAVDIDVWHGGNGVEARCRKAG